MLSIPITQDIVSCHLQAFDLATIMDDFAEDSFHTSNAVNRGYDEIREIFSELFLKFPPGFDIQIIPTLKKHN